MLVPSPAHPRRGPPTEVAFHTITNAIATAMTISVFAASNRDAEINVGHDVLRLELGLAVEHRTTPCNCLSLDTPSGRSEFVPRKCPKSVLEKKNLAISTDAKMARFVRYLGGCRPC